MGAGKIGQHVFFSTTTMTEPRCVEGRRLSRSDAYPVATPMPNSIASMSTLLL